MAMHPDALVQGLDSALAFGGAVGFCVVFSESKPLAHVRS